MACVRLLVTSLSSRAPLSYVPMTDAPPSLPMSVSSAYIICLHLGLHNQQHIKDRPLRYVTTAHIYVVNML